MKFAKFTVVALFAAFLAVGCSDEKIPFYNEKGNVSEGGESTPSNVGYLSISNLEVDYRIVSNDPDTGVDPSVAKHSTRTSSLDVNNFDCSIINEAGEVVMSFKYGERPTEAIELEAGDYIFKIQSGEVEGAAWESPVYGATDAFKIVRKEPTTLSKIVCSLMQIKVTITYAADLMERLRETNTTVTVGTNSLVYTLDESKAGYFYAPQMTNTINLLIDGQYAADKVNFKPVKMTKQIPDVKVGQYSKVHLYITHADEGNIEVSAPVDPWVTDDVIPCNVADQVTEEEWKDDEENEDPAPVDAPDIIWEGYDFSKRYAITNELTVDLVVVASSGIKELLCEIKSETLTPEQLSDTGLCNVLNLCYPKQSYDSNSPTVFVDVEQPLRDLGFAVAEGVLNHKSVNLSITKFLGILRGVSGTSLKNHDFVLTVTDNNGTTTVKTLQLQTGN